MDTTRAAVRWRSLPIAALAALAALLLSTSPTLAQEPNETIRVAVVDFDTDAIRGDWHYAWPWRNLARAASDDLTTELSRIGRFRVVERPLLDKMLADQNLGESARVDPSTAARVGKILGVQLVVVGSVTEFEVSEKGGDAPPIGSWKGWSGAGAKVVTGTVALTVRVVDPTTAEVLGTYDGRGSHTFAKGEFAGAGLDTEWNRGMASRILAEAVGQLAKEIATKAASPAPSTPRGRLEAKVAKADGATVYLNVGSAAGVKPGDQFEIRRMGEAIVDPDTGEKLGAEETIVGAIEITKVINERLSAARAIQGGDFKIGDRAVMK